MFHSLQVKHFPVHLTLSAPQFAQTWIVAVEEEERPAALRWEGGERDGPRDCTGRERRSLKEEIFEGSIEIGSESSSSEEEEEEEEEEERGRKE